MEHVRQRYNGCGLASLAMVSGIPENTVYHYACELGYDSNVGLPDGMLGILLKSLLSYTLGPWNESRLTAIQNIMKSNPNPDLTGIGLLRIGWADRECHLMAFENGQVFDPNCDKSYSWEDWCQVIPRLYPGKLLGWYEIVYRKEDNCGH